MYEGGWRGSEINALLAQLVHGRRGAQQLPPAPRLINVLLLLYTRQCQQVVSRGEWRESQGRKRRERNPVSRVFRAYCINDCSYFFAFHRSSCPFDGSNSISLSLSLSLSLSVWSSSYSSCKPIQDLKILSPTFIFFFFFFFIIFFFLFVGYSALRWRERGPFQFNESKELIIIILWDSKVLQSMMHIKWLNKKNLLQCSKSA